MGDSKMAPTWELEDVELAAQGSPSFFVPKKDERFSLKAGAVVRLHFVLLDPAPDAPRAERMWVEVESVIGFGRYRGYLTNRPQSIEGLAQGDLIEFGAEHVARTLIDRDDPRWYANAERNALVSEKVFEDCCRWLYRETPDRDEDSGWRLFSGRESEQDVSDASMIRICNVSWLCDYDPSLAPILRRDDLVAFERKERGAPWIQADDWEPDAD
jgi:hypothetical protein